MEIDRSRYEHLFSRSEEYADFMEFLYDHYLNDCEFELMWDDFIKWRDAIPDQYLDKFTDKSK